MCRVVSRLLYHHSALGGCSLKHIHTVLEKILGCFKLCLQQHKNSFNYLWAPQNRPFTKIFIKVWLKIQILFSFSRWLTVFKVLVCSTKNNLGNYEKVASRRVTYVPSVKLNWTSRTHVLRVYFCYLEVEVSTVRQTWILRTYKSFFFHEQGGIFLDIVTPV